ncbi:hypothetical protein S2M10_29570 [Sphingomonas sp. S2M10]|nr:hypothetical protein [Sphingomonas sp. S2M10]NLS27955.1 hypothetical protein [Sphingomonas sp. S2M10]
MATPEQLAALKRLDAARRQFEREQGLEAARAWRQRLLRGAGRSGGSPRT